MKKYVPLLLALAAVLLLSCRPAHAANFAKEPYFSGQSPTLTGYYANPAVWGQAGTYSQGGGAGAVSIGASNGLQASSTGAGASGLVIKSEFPISALPPSGNAVSPAVAATALGLIGGAPIAIGAAVIMPTITNPSAALSAASGLMTTAGWMLSGTPAGIPLIAAGAAIGLIPSACAAVSGCQWLQAMAQQGVTVNSSGQTMKTTFPNTVPSGIADFQIGTLIDSTSAAVCQKFVTTYSAAPNIKALVSVVPATTPPPVSGVCNYSNTYYSNPPTYSSVAINNHTTAGCPAGYTLISSVCTLTDPSLVVGGGTVAPATNTDVIAAINASTAANNQNAATAAQNAAGADMINLALLGALNMSSLNYSTLQTQVASSFSELSKSTDNLGNTVQILSRTISTIPAQSSTPANTPFNPQISQQSQTVTVTNGTATQSVSNTATPPALLNASTAPTPTDDLCVKHPDILACAGIASLNDLAAVSAPSQSVDIGSMTPVAVGGAAICPPPFVMPGMMGGPPVTVDIWRDPCRFAVSIKPFTVAVAALASMFILIGAFKNG